MRRRNISDIVAIVGPVIWAVSLAIVGWDWYAGWDWYTSQERK